jgi:hypothetical protein
VCGVTWLFAYFVGPKAKVSVVSKIKSVVLSAKTKKVMTAEEESKFRIREIGSRKLALMIMVV